MNFAHTNTDSEREKMKIKCIYCMKCTTIGVRIDEIPNRFFSLVGRFKKSFEFYSMKSIIKPPKAIDSYKKKIYTEKLMHKIMDAHSNTDGRKKNIDSIKFICVISFHQ